MSCTRIPFFFLMTRRPPGPSLLPFTTLFRSTWSFWLSHGSTSLGETSVWKAQFSFRPLGSEEHTLELQSHSDLVCRLLLEKKKIHLRQIGVLLPVCGLWNRDTDHNPKTHYHA